MCFLYLLFFLILNLENASASSFTPDSVLAVNVYNFVSQEVHVVSREVLYRGLAKSLGMDEASFWYIYKHINPNVLSDLEVNIVLNNFLHSIFKWRATYLSKNQSDSVKKEIRLEALNAMFDHYSEFLSAVPFKVINFKDSLERVSQLGRKLEQLTKNLKALANLFSHFNEEEKIMNFKIDMDHLSDKNNTTIYAWMTKSLDMDDEKYTDLYKKIDETNRLSKREKNLILSNILSSAPKKIANFKNSIEKASTEDEKVR